MSVRERIIKIDEDPNLRIKYGIWIYFLLLIFEGALRKWILPGLAAPLLIIRDPVALWLLVATWRKGLLPYSIYLFTIVGIGLVSFFTALFLGHGNMMVAFYGARILIIHFPVVFVIGAVFSYQDVIKMGKAVLIISIPMTVLIALQFYNPQSAWVNRGVGGDAAGAGFDGAMGFFRPPGTFSFTNGTSLFYGLAGAYILYFLFNMKNISQLILLAAAICLLSAIPLSISRTLLLHVSVSLLFVFIASFMNPKHLPKILLASTLSVIIVLVLANTSFFNTASDAFSARFQNASDAEGGIKGTILDRYIGGLVKTLNPAYDAPFFGYGAGLGTNVGSQLMTGSKGFLLAEDEWGRLIGEMGLLLGFLVIVSRLFLCLNLGMLSLKKMVSGDLLPWMLFSFEMLLLVQGAWAQPTALGFCILAAGLVIASFKGAQTV